MFSHNWICWGRAWRLLPAFALASGITLSAAENLVRPSDVLCLAGGENAASLFETGHLELELRMQPGFETLRVRGLAVEGDTVGEQFRPLNFPGWREQLASAQATVVMAQFGNMEVLEPDFSPGRFMENYLEFLARVQPESGRLILLSPTPFHRPEPPLPDLTRHNANLALLTSRIRGLAAARGWGFVDLFNPLLDHPSATRDGIHLSAQGQQLAAGQIASQLGLRANEKPDAALLGMIREKNQLWLRWRRPQNWAFLNGDRTSQPSSRDHLNPAIRWFPKEMEQFIPLIEAKEIEIRNHLQPGARQP